MGYFTTSVPRIEKAVAAAGIPIEFVGVWNPQLEAALQRFADENDIVTDVDNPVARGNPNAPDVQVGPRALHNKVIQASAQFDKMAKEAEGVTQAPVGVATRRRAPVPGGLPRVGPGAAPYAPTLMQNSLSGVGGGMGQMTDGQRKTVVYVAAGAGVLALGFMLWKLSKG